jgi:hypothetical protein
VGRIAEREALTKLTVHRVLFSDQSTQGSLDVNGTFEAYTLEPRKDQSEGKPYCIPVGTYPVQLQWSNHFQRITPHIQDVQGFEDIEIHPGNFSQDTHGCTLIGQTRQPDFIGNSELAFESLMAKLSGQTEISITYQEELSQ